jgi:predicted NBD/HSP70 family sugar kinase
VRQYVGLDIHREFVRACVLDRDGTAVDQRRLEPTEPDEAVGFFAGLKAHSTEVVTEARACVAAARKMGRIIRRMLKEERPRQNTRRRSRVGSTGAMKVGV